MTRSYSFSEELCLESFGNEAILLVADWDRLLTVDAAAAQLLSFLQSRLGTEPFSRNGLSSLLSEHYELSEMDANEEMVKLLIFGLRQRIIHKG